MPTILGQIHDMCVAEALEIALAQCTDTGRASGNSLARIADIGDAARGNILAFTQADTNIGVAHDLTLGARRHAPTTLAESLQTAAHAPTCCGQKSGTRTLCRGCTNAAGLNPRARALQRVGLTGMISGRATTIWATWNTFTCVPCHSVRSGGFLPTKTSRAVRGEMNDRLGHFVVITIGLCIGLGAILSTAFRTNISANWDANRCDPYVVPMAGFFKPSTDPRTAAQFAKDNWSFCQKEYVQDAIRTAAAVPKELAEAEAATVGVVQDIASVFADIFADLWKFCYEAYSTFMDRMKGASKLFHNFMINLHSIVGRLQAATLSIVYGLIALITAFVSSVQLVLIVAIVIIGILIALQIILFFILLPISGLIITMTAVISVVVVAIATAISAAMVAELFTPGACFVTGTPVIMHDGTTRPIDQIKIGDALGGGARVTATHRFRTADTVYDIDGIGVTGDHLVVNPSNLKELIPVHRHPDSKPIPVSWTNWMHGGRDLWCLTTTNRRIPCKGATTGAILFADWEEIPEGDDDKLAAWFRSVWTTLNGRESIARKPMAHVLDAEAGLSPDCRVAIPNWLGGVTWRPIRDIRVGDRVFDETGRTTAVVGKVRIEGDMTTDAVELRTESGGVQFVSPALWVHHETIWQPAAFFAKRVDVHFVALEHLYTASGSFMIESGHRVRDASDVGLGGLRPIVEDVVLELAQNTYTI